MTRPKGKKKPVKGIILSRTDSIGDVILSLPMAGVLKELYPETKLIFLGKNYTREIIHTCKHIDEFLDWDELREKDGAEQVREMQSTGAEAIIHVFPRKEIALLAKKSGIPLRYGTTNRLYHWYSCNRLIRLSRRTSELHEAQLNLKLLRPLGAKEVFAIDEIPAYYGFQKLNGAKHLEKYLREDRLNLILHPKSKGSAREWGTDNFSKLIGLLPKEDFNVIITGTEEEGKLIRDSILNKFPHLQDTTGKLSLRELISLINLADVLVAGSTGPLHIAAALGKTCIGIYPPIRPMHPGRWAPIGENAHYLVEDKECDLCRKNLDCKCIRNIAPVRLIQKIMEVTA